MNAVDVKGLGLFHLPIQLSSTHIGPVLQICLEALTRDICSLDGQISVFVVKCDPDVRVGDHAGDRALLTGLCDHAVGALNEPHLRVWGQKRLIIFTAKNKICSLLGYIFSECLVLKTVLQPVNR